VSVPSTWTLAWAQSSAASDERRGNVYDVAYRAPVGTTLAGARGRVPHGTTYPGESGTFASRLTQARVQPDLKTGQVLVTYHYDPPTLDDVLINDTNKVLVSARSAESVERPVVDLNGDYVWHHERDPDEGPSYKWQPVKGSGLRYDQRIQFRTRFAKPYQMGGYLLSYHNSLNAAYYAQYWYCPVETLRFAGWAKERARTTQQLWLYDALIFYNPEGWNKETRVERYEYRAFKVRVRDEAGDLLGESYVKEVGDWFPTGEQYDAKFYDRKQWPLILGSYNW